jgi:hypothetical protein
MPIYRRLKGTAFQPEDVAMMAVAFEQVCRNLDLAEKDDELRDLVAQASHQLRSGRGM